MFRLPMIITNYDTPLDKAFSTARVKESLVEELLILLIYNRNEVQTPQLRQHLNDSVQQTQFRDQPRALLMNKLRSYPEGSSVY